MLYHSSLEFSPSYTSIAEKANTVITKSSISLCIVIFYIDKTIGARGCKCYLNTLQYYMLMCIELCSQ